MRHRRSWNAFVVWARQSALGHVALSEVIGFVPLSLVFLGLDYSDGTLTLDWALYTIFMSFVCMSVGGLLCWFTLTKPMIKRAADRASRNRP